MARLDKIHDAVKNALVKDGWNITNEPYIIKYGKRRLYADLAAQKVSSDESDEIIIVEIKSFLSPSQMDDLENALGQYNLYQTYIELTAPRFRLYLAIDDYIYEKFFATPEIQVVVKRFQMSIVTVNLLDEEIVKWIK